jgi:hypothetical protein
MQLMADRHLLLTIPPSEFVVGAGGGGIGRNRERGRRRRVRGGRRHLELRNPICRSGPLGQDAWRVRQAHRQQMQQLLPSMSPVVRYGPRPQLASILTIQTKYL